MQQSQSLFDGAMCAVFCHVSDRTPGSEQLHSGFVVQGDNGSYFIVDLQWHYLFSDRPLDADVAYIYATPPAWGEVNQEIISARLSWLASKYKNKIPYSVAGYGVKFRNGDWLGVEEGNGLTCTTFVSEFLASLALPLIDLNNWYPREGDEQWRQKIMIHFERAVANNKMTREHVEFQRNIIERSNVARVRPADVIVAASKPLTPLSLDAVAHDSERLSISIMDCTVNTRCSTILT